MRGSRTSTSGCSPPHSSAARPSGSSCYDNACAESLFHSLKVELIHGEHIDTREVIRQPVFEYIEVDYNRICRHSANGNISPPLFEAKLIALGRVHCWWLGSIEYNLDVIKTADWIVDPGTESGSGGGQIIATGTPEQMAKHKASHTGKFFKETAEQKINPTWGLNEYEGRGLPE